MTLTLNIAGDFVAVVDNLIPVTLVLRDTGIIYSITHALRTAVKITEYTPSGGEVKSGDVRFLFPASESVTSNTDLLGSKIADESGEDFTILDASYQVWSSQWSVRTRNLVVEAGLNTTVTLAGCSYYKHSSSGEAVEAWETISSSIRAKIQLETASVSVDDNMDKTPRTYRITLEFELSVIPGADYRILDSAGVVYRMQSYHASQQIDALPYLIAKRTE